MDEPKRSALLVVLGSFILFLGLFIISEFNIENDLIGRIVFGIFTIVGTFLIVWGASWILSVSRLDFSSNGGD
jgi:hypothetical protein